MEEKIKEAKKRLDALRAKQRQSLLKLQSHKKEKVQYTKKLIRVFNINNKFDF